MSSTVDTEDVVTVSDEGIAVRKEFSPDEFPVPAIRFEIVSSRDEAVTVRLSEEIPESFSMDGVGFHPEYHSDQWTAYQDHRVEFTGTVEPDSPLVTVYGVRLDDVSEGGQFMTEPSIVDVRPEGTDASTPDDDDRAEDATIEDIVSTDRDQVVKDMLSGDSDGVPGLGADASAGDAAEASDADAEPSIELDIDAAAERVKDMDDGSSASDSADGAESTSRRSRDRSVVSRDESGTGAEPIEPVTDDLDAIRGELADVASTVAELDDRVADVETDVDELADDLESISADVTDIVQWREQLGSIFSED